MPTILITGASGFLGRHAIAGFRNAGWTVVGLCRNIEKIHRFIPEMLHEKDVNIMQHEGDYENLLEIVKAFRPDVVIHLATLYIKDHQHSDIDSLIKANISYGCYLLEAMTNSGVRKMVVTGTAWQHYHVHDDSYRPANLYAATKQAFEDIVRWYVDACCFSVLSLHLTDMYGPRDDRGKLFQKLKEAAITGSQISLTAGDQLLDPLYVSDAVNALVLSAKMLLNNNAALFKFYRVSPGNPRTLREIVETWQKVTGYNVPISWGSVPYRTREVMYPWQAGELLPGWSPQISLESGLRCL